MKMRQGTGVNSSLQMQTLKLKQNVSGDTILILQMHFCMYMPVYISAA